MTTRMTRLLAALTAAMNAGCIVGDTPPPTPEDPEPPLDADFPDRLEGSWVCGGPSYFYKAWSHDRTVRIHVEVAQPGEFTLDGSDALPSVWAHAGECLVVRDCDLEPMPPPDGDCEQRVDHTYEAMSGTVTVTESAGGVAVRLDQVVFEGKDGEDDLVLDDVALPGAALESSSSG